MSAVADARGLKRICTACGARFYDLNKRPIICPSCGAEFSLEEKNKSRKSRNVPEAAAEDTKTASAEEGDNSKTQEGEEELISLEDLESDEDNEDDDDHFDLGDDLNEDLDVNIGADDDDS